MCGASNPSLDENASLRRLAEALGGSVQSLFGAAAEPSDLSEINELLSLMAALTSDRSRAEALSAVRAIVVAQSN